MGLELQKDMLPILAVVLITWGGVLGYMFRLDRTTKELERRVDDLEITGVEKRDDIAR